MHYFGEFGLFLAVVMACVGLGAGWSLRRTYESRALLLDREAPDPLKPRSLPDLGDPMPGGTDQVALQESLDRVAICEAEIAELQSLLSLAERERDLLRACERRLSEQVRDLEEAANPSSAILVQ